MSVSSKNGAASRISDDDGKTSVRVGTFRVVPLVRVPQSEADSKGHSCQGAAAVEGIRSRIRIDTATIPAVHGSYLCSEWFDG